MKLIPLSSGESAIVDDSDYVTISKFKWSLKKSNGGKLLYAVRRPSFKGKRIEIVMHRLLLGLDGKSESHVDHINGNGLDNRRANIRRCTQGENSRNLHRAWGRYGVRGVTKDGKKFRARIRHNYKLIPIGHFDTERDAAIAYAFASKLVHGEFGSLPGHKTHTHVSATPKRRIKSPLDQIK